MYVHPPRHQVNTLKKIAMLQNTQVSALETGNDYYIFKMMTILSKACSTYMTAEEMDA